MNKGHQGSKNPESMEMMRVGLSHNEIENCWTEMKQSNSPELLNLLLHEIYHKNDPTNAKNDPTYVWASWND